MDYLIHFEDGTDAYLSHYGVKGMKWGVHKMLEDVSTAAGGALEDTLIDTFGSEEERQEKDKRREEERAAEEARRTETVEIPNWQYGMHDQWKAVTNVDIPKTVKVTSVNDYNAEREYEFVRRQKMMEGLDSGDEESIKRNTEAEIAWREEGRQRYMKTGDPKDYMQFKGLRMPGSNAPNTSTYHDTPEVVRERERKQKEAKQRQQEKIAKARGQFEAQRNGVANVRSWVFGKNRSNMLLKSQRKKPRGGTGGGKF